MSLLGFKAQNHPQQMLPATGSLDEVDDRATHPLHFAEIQERLGVEFTLDVAAAAHNAKCPRFFDRATNGLNQSWAGEHVWCNPPYSAIQPWLIKAWEERDRALSITMLLPANRTEQKWWQRHVEPFRDRAGSGLRVEFLPGRMRFIKAGQLDIGPNERPPLRLLPAHLHADKADRMKARCPRCGKTWGGLKTSHCTVCHETFSVDSNGDKHRKGTHTPDTRHCVDPHRQEEKT